MKKGFRWNEEMFAGKRYKVRKICPGNRTGEGFAVTIPRIHAEKIKYVKFNAVKKGFLLIKLM